MDLENWLRRRPRPSRLRMTLASGDLRELSCESVRSWAVVAQSVSALDPDVIEALDASGAIIRVLSPDDMVKPERAAAPPPPPAPKVLSQDPETRRLEVVAGLLADAYRHSTEVAFGRMVDLFAAVNERSEHLEKSLENMHKLMRRALQDQYDDAVEAAAQVQQPQKDGFGLEDLAKAFVGGTAQAPHATNGKGHA